MGLKCGCELIQSRGHLTAIHEAKDQKSKSKPWNAPGLQCELKRIKMEIFNKADCSGHFPSALTNQSSRESGEMYDQPKAAQP